MMTLVDTSIWVDHFRVGNNALRGLLMDGEVLVHPFVIGELSLGTMLNRGETLGLLARLPEAVVASHKEVVHLVEEKRLSGTGLGWIDAHLLASALIGGAKLLTGDRALRQVSRSLHIEASL